MRLLLIRHGDPDYDKDCLTGKGHRQAKVLAQRLMTEDIDEIYSSPLGRALETTKYFSVLSGIGEIRILDFMEEIRYGREEALYESGNPWFGVQDLISEGWDARDSEWRTHPFFKDNTCTQDADKIFLRSDEWLAALGYEREGLYYRNKGGEEVDKNLALFCHGGAITAFMSHALNIPFPLALATLHLKHTSITILRFDKEEGSLAVPILELVNDHAHLKSS